MRLPDSESFGPAPGGREPSSCEGCGEPFACGASLAGCWCAEVELSAETREHLRARYRDCLCRACLERLASAHAGGADPSAREPRP